MLCCALMKPDTARPALCTLSTLDTCTCHLTLNRSAACDKHCDNFSSTQGYTLRGHNMPVYNIGGQNVTRLK